jgi:hypothetical protein
MTPLPNIPPESVAQYDPILAPLHHWESLIGSDSGDNDNSNTYEHDFEDVDLEATSEDVNMVDGTNNFIYYNDNNALADATRRLEEFMSLPVKARSAGMWGSIFSTHPEYWGPKCTFWESSLARVLKEVCWLSLLINHYMRFELHIGR